ncbi:3'-5' RNA helicase YTHDC2-like isoform X1 [Lytechinus pictus]|uniref:3'-5' RNA helicase YTHDC2-like isoform X1 n=1 Tax=Lytechinus pictus TaxID=7653 RepID=UPI0030B9EE0F
MGDRGRGKSRKPKKEICVGEEFKISVDIAIQQFRHDESETVLEFPASFSNNERAYIHRLATTCGLKSKSKGKGSNRYLTLTKKSINRMDDNGEEDCSPAFQMGAATCNELQGLLQQFPVTAKERQELQPKVERRRFGPSEVNPAREMNKATGRLNSSLPQVPSKRNRSDLDSFRQTLPVYAMRNEILATINNNRVVLVVGDTGSGKTTQLPQFILDECFEMKRPCRIICTQPRRISALSVSERVAAERGEAIGQTVGYQIRLESRVSPKTLLTYCTNGVLLRTLMTGDAALDVITHVIIDEIHERDRFSDFLVTQIRDLMTRKRHLTLVLMSAALDVQLFVRYFNNCPIVSVPGNMFDVEELFLEDALKCTRYTNAKMIEYQKEKGKVAKQQQQLNKWYNTDQVGGASASKGHSVAPVHPSVDSLSRDFRATTMGPSAADTSIDVEDMAEWLIHDMDSALSDCWKTGDDDYFSQLLYLLLNENVSVDYAHSESSVTPLMVAAGRGNVEMVEQLLSLGANASLKASDERSALDFARMFNQTEVLELLQAYLDTVQATNEDESELLRNHSEVSAEDRELLQAYHHSFDDERVDLNLILALLDYICSNSQEGAILVFLPGYDDIVTLRDMLLQDDTFSDRQSYQIYTLHSSMQSHDQKKVFKTPGQNIRKIVLSTNIAETSVTINDVVFVIDSGKVKEKSFDAIANISSLKSNWISKASAKQRRGRAGRVRPGMCFHLISRVRYQSLPDFQVPEILRTPLHELCLHTKLLAPNETSVGDFLKRAPEPPATVAIRNAVNLLKSIDAMDKWEDLTELGCHLADLPVDPRLGKMVLYAIVLKCLDPVLTIVCALAYKDPFVLPSHPSQKRGAMQIRKKYSSNTFSDHMALLRAFQSWQRARSDGWEGTFCDRNFLSRATMEMIVGMRTQLLGQLRASGFVRARGPGDIRDLNTNSENWAVVKASLCAGMYPNILKVDRERRQLTTKTESKVRFHPNSVLHEVAKGKTSLGEEHMRTVDSLPSDWLLYDELTSSHFRTSVRCVTLISPITIALFCGPTRLPYDALVLPEGTASSIASRMGPNGDAANDSSEGEDDDVKVAKATLKLDEWLVIKSEPMSASLVLQLRTKWHTLFMRRMRTPAKPWSQADEAVLKTLIKVLTNEEQSLGLQQPVGVGQRPKPMAIEQFNSPPSGSLSNRFANSQQQGKGRGNWRGNDQRQGGAYGGRGGGGGSGRPPPPSSPSYQQTNGGYRGQNQGQGGAWRQSPTSRGGPAGRWNNSQRTPPMSPMVPDSRHHQRGANGNSQIPWSTQDGNSFNPMAHSSPAFQTGPQAFKPSSNPDRVSPVPYGGGRDSSRGRKGSPGGGGGGSKGSRLNVHAKEFHGSGYKPKGGIRPPPGFSQF